MVSELLVFNGIDGASGDYLLPPMSPQTIAAIVRGETWDKEHLSELRWRHRLMTEQHLAPIEGINPKNLAETGWGIIFAHDAHPGIREALSELLDHRKEQATRIHEHFYRELVYYPGQSKLKFLADNGAGPGPVDPNNLPYYLLIAADPESIPNRFESETAVQYAVGRIYFDTLDEYAQYARSVVMAETGKVTLPRQAVFVGVQNPDDRATQLSASELVGPLSERIRKGQPTWNIDLLADGVGSPSSMPTKANLRRLLGGETTPAFLFTASHGMGFPNGDPRQLPHQGALLCQDWPGPVEWRGSIPQDYYLAHDDIDDNASLIGLIAFTFGCYSAGTPYLDDFAKQAFKQQTAIAPHGFVAQLPQRLLGHPRGGALAVIGHVDRAWSYSFRWDQAGPQLQVFESTLKRLMEGHPVGSAVEYFHVRYAELSTSLSNELEWTRKETDPYELAGLWTANNDARGFAIIGDPAVRIPVGDPPGDVPQRPAIEPVEHRATVLPPIKAPGPAQPAAPVTPPADGVAPYGLFDSFRGTQERLSEALLQFADSLTETLKRAIEETTSLEVATYVSDDLAGVTYRDGQFSDAAKLRAVTRISFDGDVLVCVPEQGGAINAQLWAMHADMVKQAQAHRTELLTVAVSAATGLLDAVKKL